jgi:holo-[acyl-carrier protein] synthase
MLPSIVRRCLPEVLRRAEPATVDCAAVCGCVARDLFGHTRPHSPHLAGRGVLGPGWYNLGVSIVGIGVDAVDVATMRRTIERTPSFVTRCFTEGERDYAGRAVDSAERYAVRFAAKEAVMKAMGVGLGAFGFYDVEVKRADDGVPSLSITGAAADLAAARGITRWHLSLTHTDLVAIAYVVAETD